MIFITEAAILALQEGDPPFTHARIGYENIARDATINASSAASGFPAVAARNPDTYTFWQPASLPATWQVTTGDAETVDYVGIASHDLGSTGVTVTVEYSEDEQEWEEFASVSPGSDAPLMILGEATTAPFWRLSLSSGDSPAVPPTIGVIYMGRALAMQRAMYGGHSPANLSRETEKMPNISEAGQFLGNSIIRRGVGTSVQWSNLTAEWYREKFDPFVKAARKYPFFFAWRPETFPNEVAYAWADGDIAPQNQGIRDFMSVGFSMTGIGDYE